MADVDAGPAFEAVQKEYFDSILGRVISHAKDLAREDGRESINHVDAVRAFEWHFKPPENMMLATRTSWYEDNAFIIIIVIMTLVFGAMGLIPALIGANADKLGYQPGAFLDMSKLFAGVLVGGAAGATAATTAKSRGKGT